jgi:hypothetical protein
VFPTWFVVQSELCTYLTVNRYVAQQFTPDNGPLVQDNNRPNVSWIDKVMRLNAQTATIFRCIGPDCIESLLLQLLDELSS